MIEKTSLDGFAYDKLHCGPEADSGAVCAFENCICALWPKEEYDTNGDEIDEEDIAMASPLFEKELHGIDAIRD